MKKKITNRWHYYALFILFLSTFVIKNIFSVNIPDYLLMGILILMVVFGNKVEIISVCILCIPLIMVIKCSYVILIAILIILIKYRNQIKINLSIFPIMLLVIWELLHCFDGPFSITSLVGLFIPYILSCLLMGMDLKKIDYKFIVRSLAVCTCVMCIVLLGYVLAQSNFNWATAFLNMQRLGMLAEETDEISFAINPNTLGVVCVLALSGLLQLLIVKENKPSDLYMIVIMSICGTLTLSRTFIVLFLIMLILFLFAYKGSLQRKIQFSMTLVLGSLIIIMFLNILFPDAINNVQERFLEDDISSGRGDLFGTYNEFIFSSGKIMIAGIGATDFSKKVTEQYDVAQNVPHNGIQEMIIAWGIIGVILFLWFMGVLVNNAKNKNKNIGLINYIPMILIAAKIQVGQFLTSDYTMLALAFVYLSLCQNFSQVNFKKCMTLQNKREESIDI